MAHHGRIVNVPEDKSGYSLRLPHCSPRRMDIELLEACDHEEGDFSRALQLISQGVDPKSARDWKNWTPLHFACKKGNLRVVKTLVEEYSCDFECKTSFYWSGRYYIPAGSTPQHVACSYGHLEVVRYLTSEQHCSLQCSSEDGRTPLYLACQGGHLEVVRYLTSKQYCNLESRDQNGRTPLHLVCWWGHLDVVKYLTTEQHCNLESIDYEGQTPLHLACQCGHLEVVKYLTSEQHCNLERRDKNGHNPFLLACRWGRLEVVKYLTSEQHCNLQSIDCERQTSLHLACQWGHLEVVKYLTSEQHCNIACSDNYGWTPVHLACRWGHLEVVKYLACEQHCNLENTDRENQTPLHLACWAGHLEVVKYLTIEQHCNLERRDYNGQTPLHLACQEQHFAVAWCFIKDQHCCVKRGLSDAQTLLDWANRKGVLQQLTSEHHGGILLEKGVIEDLLLWASRNGVLQHFNSQHHGGIILEKGDAEALLVWANEKRHHEVAWYLIKNKHCTAKVGLSDAQALLEWANQREGILQHLMFKHHGGFMLDKSDAEVLLLWASKEGYLIIVQYLKNVHHCSLECTNENGETSLHLACRYGHSKIVHYLLSERGCDANSITKNGSTPLSVTDDPTIIRELLRRGANPENVYVQYGNHLPKHSQKQPKDATVKTFTVGDPGAGKTTLLKALEKEGKGLYRITNRLMKVSGIDQKTAGIIPHSIESRTFGHVTFYDFAGHKEFYGSHAAIIRQSMTGSSGAIFLLLADLRSSEEDFKGSILSWLSFIDNQCPLVDPKPHIIIVGSHADETKSKAEIANKSCIVDSLVPTAVFANLQFTGFVAINCCYSESTSISELRQHLSRSCEVLRIKSQLSFNTYCFLLYLRAKFQDFKAVQFQKVLTKISESSTEAATLSDSNTLLNFIPTESPDELCKMCEDLHERGSILLLTNTEKPEQSWIILDQTALLSQVTGTVFAPEGFEQHRDLASSTGVVPFPKLQAHFPNLDPDMVVQFLCYLEFCQEVTDHEVLQLLQTNDTPVSIKEEVFFFPALVSIDAPGTKPVAIEQTAAHIPPTKVWKPSDKFVYHSGWILQCSEPEHFFTPRFLQVLLLRLAFSFALIPDTQEIKRDLPTIQRECDVWRNGICWHNRSGVGALVEMNHSKTVNVLLRCLKGGESECIHLRSAIIHKVLCARKEFCPKVSTAEYFIHPSCAIQYPLKSTAELTVYKMSKVIETITSAEPCVKGNDNLPIHLEDLLYYEPYAHLGKSILQELFDKQNPNYDEEITDNFFYRMADHIHTKMDYFVEILRPPAGILQNMIDHAPPGSTHAIVRVFQLWRLRNNNGSYQCLRRELDQFSVFAGRNPLEITEMSAHASSRHI